MAVSQNGWPVVFDNPAGRAKLDTAPLIRDIMVPNGILEGDVATCFRWLAREYDLRVERMVKGWCWGWFVKKIRNSEIYSNHSSGTALDFNAPDNPNSPGATERSLTAKQIAECHRLEVESHNVFRWGGDFSLDDPMHWEIVGSPAQVAAFAREIEVAMATQFNSEDRDVIQAEAKQAGQELLKLKDFPTGGGEGSEAGNSIWGHGYPRTEGALRTAAWTNLQAMQSDVTKLMAGMARLHDTLALQNDKLDQIIALLTNPKV